MISPPVFLSNIRNMTMPPFRDLVSQTLASFSYLLLSLFVHIQCNGLLFPRNLNDLHAGDSPQLPDTPHTFLHITLRSLLSIAIVSVAGPWLASIAGGNITSHDANSITTCASFETLIHHQLQKMCYMFPAFLAIRIFTSSLRSPSWVKALVTLDMTKISWWSERVFWLALIPCASCVLFKRHDASRRDYLKTLTELFVSSSKRSRTWYHQQIIKSPMHQSRTLKTGRSSLQDYWLEVSVSTIALCSFVYTLSTFFDDPDAFKFMHHVNGSQTVACPKAYFGLLSTIYFGVIALGLWLGTLGQGDLIAARTRKSLSLRKENSERGMKATDFSPQEQSLLASQHPGKDRTAAEVKLSIDHILADVRNIVRDLGSTDTTLKHTAEDEEWVAVDKDEGRDTSSEHIGPLKG